MSRNAFAHITRQQVEDEAYREHVARERMETLCWSCNSVYLRSAPTCPACGKINGLVDLAGAGRQMRESE
jgi:uncharacterized OB-fold protein